MNQLNKSNTTELSETERFEYHQLSDWARHDDTMIYQAASTVLPLSFGAVAAAVQYPKMALPLALFSLALYGYWLVVAIRLSWFSAVRIDRMRVLEMKSAMQHHTQLSDPPDGLRSRLGARLSIRRFRTIGAFFLVGAWLVTLFYLHVNPGKDEKSGSNVSAAPDSAPASAVKKK